MGWASLANLPQTRKLEKRSEGSDPSSLTKAREGEGERARERQRAKARESERERARERERAFEECQREQTSNGERSSER
jgi:hypothetical protein